MKFFSFLSILMLTLTATFAKSNNSFFPGENREIMEARIRVVPLNVTDEKKKVENPAPTPCQQSNPDKIVNEHPMIKDYISHFQLSV
ncbi:MAG: hypothetical protein H0W62_13600 [Chitinophagales bacterium]|nr:hypothetical protein [Chitinophagales bacterium]